MVSSRRTLAISGVVAAAVIGGGGGFAVAHAQSTSGSTATPTATSTTSSPTGTAASSKTAKTAKAAKGADRSALIGNLKDLQHAEWVTKGTNGYVTHDAVLGKVTAVSATSITVQAGDGTSLTFAVDSSAKVKPHNAKPAKTAKTATGSPTASPTTAAPTTTSTSAATIADVTVGQSVLVSGEKTPDLTAKSVLVRAS